MDGEIDRPAPPTLDAAEDDAYRRAAIQAHLEAGAWDEALDSWYEQSDIEGDALAIADDLDLFDQFDFFWDDIAQRVGFQAPGIPDDWDRREYHEDLTSWRQASSINAGLAELGQTVCDVLETSYIDWAEDDWGDDLDLPDFES